MPNIICPHCKKEFDLSLKCLRCGHAWLPRNIKEKPKFCPKCKSPYWNKPRGFIHNLHETRVDKPSDESEEEEPTEEPEPDEEPEEMEGFDVEEETEQEEAEPEPPSYITCPNCGMETKGDKCIFCSRSKVLREEKAKEDEAKVKEIIRALAGEKGVLYKDVMTQCEETGIHRMTLEVVIQDLLDNGTIYEPTIGMINFTRRKNDVR